MSFVQMQNRFGSLQENEHDKEAEDDYFGYALC